MQRLSGQDASFLYMETPSAHMHVAGLAVFDPSTAKEPLYYARALQLTEERLHLIPYARRVVRQDPLELHHPVWVESPSFDLEYHMRRAALPAPGGARELADFAADIASRPLDRSRPLWETWWIEGLEGGRIALLSKTHHAAIDGASGTELTSVMMDLTPEPAPVKPPEQPWRPQPLPSGLELLGRSLVELSAQPLRVGRFVAKTGRRVLRSGIDGLRSREPEGEAPAAPALAPATSLNGSITPHRKFAFCQLPLAELRRVKSTLGGTVNDVVLALCSGALRRYFEARDERVEESLVASIPISVRTEEQKGTLGNRVSFMAATLENQISDPVERLRRISAGTAGAKERHNAIGADALQNVQEFMPPAVFARAMRLYSRTKLADRLRPVANLVISNVPGPPVPLYSYGAKMVASYPMGPLMDGLRLNITVTSYDGTMFFGFMGCREAVGDLWQLGRGVAASLGELSEAATARGR
jgi:WS/DGAT/MGAT family acyltransferase